MKWESKPKLTHRNKWINMNKKITQVLFIHEAWYNKIRKTAHKGEDHQIRNLITCNVGKYYDKYVHTYICISTKII